MPRLYFSPQYTEEEKGILTATVESNVEFMNIAGLDFSLYIGKKHFPDKRLYGYLTPTGTSPARDFEIFLNDRNDLHRNIRTLSHEMVHAEQHLTGKLRAAFDGLYWKDRFVPGFIVTDMNYYSVFPWELEAHHWDKKLYSIAVKKMNLKEMEENDD